MAVYNFKSFIFSMTGAGLLIPNVESIADDGVTLESQSDSGDTKPCLDGGYVISKREDRRMKITFNLWQNSPIVPLLQLAYNMQNSDPQLYGSNTIVIVNSASLANYSLVGCRFMGQATIDFKQDVSSQQWEFMAGDYNIVQGGS